MRFYFIKARYVENLGMWWMQLIDTRGHRPFGFGIPTSKRYKSLKVGARNFTRYRNELERRG